MVYARHIIGSEIILDAPDGTLGDEAQVQASFGPFRDSANLDVDWCTACAKYTIGLETFLDTPDGTRRRRGSSASPFRCV